MLLADVAVVEDELRVAMCTADRVGTVGGEIEGGMGPAGGGDVE